jgi:hypothetical protein
MLLVLVRKLWQGLCSASGKEDEQRVRHVLPVDMEVVVRATEATLEALKGVAGDERVAVLAAELPSIEELRAAVDTKFFVMGGGMAIEALNVETLRVGLEELLLEVQDARTGLYSGCGVL